MIGRATPSLRSMARVIIGGKRETWPASSG
jgi:hypothetical protein